MEAGSPAINDELQRMEMFAAAARGQVHAGGAAVEGSQKASAAGLGVKDSVSISPEAYALASVAATDTE